MAGDRSSKTLGGPVRIVTYGRGRSTLASSTRFEWADLMQHSRRFPTVMMVAVLLGGCIANDGGRAAAARMELAPEGVLRVAVAIASAPSTFYSAIDSTTGMPSGVAVDLGAQLADALEVPVEYVTYRSSAEITEAADLDQWDVTFMPVDEERSRQVSFGPAYNVFHSTFLVQGDSAIQTVDQVDREDLLVGVVEGTTTGRSAVRWLSRATVRNYHSVDELRHAILAGEVDAIALSEASLKTVAAGLPAARILEGSFHSTENAVAVPNGRAGALAFLAEFIEAAKRSGHVRAAFDRYGLPDATVPP
jgi:polar amino acid transport system substrate-binding protein